MRTPRSLIAALVSTAALALTPMVATAGETIDFQLDLEAPAADVYKAIRKQAWAACKPETGSHFIHARTSARRACQQSLIADVVETLSSPEVIVLAQKDGIHTKS